jgi:CRISPR system Cascade subunit CasB
MEPWKPNGPERVFVARLDALVERGDRGSLAALRRGLAEESGSLEALLVLGRVLPADLSERDEETHGLVAALFAATQRGNRDRSTTEGDLGASLARLLAKRSEASVTPRVLALLATRREDLVPPLRRAVTILDSDGIGIDWAQLLHDLLAWDHPDRVVQRRWTRSYRRALAPDPADVPATSPETGVA